MTFVVWMAITVAALLVAEKRGSQAGVWVAKPLAATAFIAAAIAWGACDSTWGRIVLAGLALSWLGDVLLIPRSQAIFQAGIASFLLGHVAYAAAFLSRGVSLAWTLGALAA